MWRELWWNMADGVKSEYDRVKKTDVLEFWKLFDLWSDALKKERDNYKQQTQKNGR
jgi:hypothetical protein